MCQRTRHPPSAAVRLGGTPAQPARPRHGHHQQDGVRHHGAVAGPLPAMSARLPAHPRPSLHPQPRRLQQAQQRRQATRRAAAGHGLQAAQRGSRRDAPASGRHRRGNHGQLRTHGAVGGDQSAQYGHRAAVDRQGRRRQPVALLDALAAVLRRALLEQSNGHRSRVDRKRRVGGYRLQQFVVTAVLRHSSGKRQHREVDRRRRILDLARYAHAHRTGRRFADAEQRSDWLVAQRTQPRQQSAATVPLGRATNAQPGSGRAVFPGARPRTTAAVNHLRLYRFTAGGWRVFVHNLSGLTL